LLNGKKSGVLGNVDEFEVDVVRNKIKIKMEKEKKAAAAAAAAAASTITNDDRDDDVTSSATTATQELEMMAISKPTAADTEQV
jgi:hypothetical protein